MPLTSARVVGELQHLERSPNMLFDVVPTEYHEARLCGALAHVVQGAPVAMDTLMGYHGNTSASSPDANSSATASNETG